MYRAAEKGLMVEDPNTLSHESFMVMCLKFAYFRLARVNPTHYGQTNLLQWNQLSRGKVVLPIHNLLRRYGWSNTVHVVVALFLYFESDLRFKIS